MAATNFRITRRLVIEAGHRVLSHGSKCKNLHGHRYVIEATAEGGLQDSGTQSGMVTDFGIIKQLMVELIESYFDHSMIAWIEDKDLLDAYGVDVFLVKQNVEAYGLYKVQGKLGCLTIVDFTPTAENLANYWFILLQSRIKNKVDNVKICKVRVWETENCYAEYPC